MANIFNEFFTSMFSKLLQISILLTQIMFLILSNISLLMTRNVQFLFLVSMILQSPRRKVIMLPIYYHQKNPRIWMVFLCFFFKKFIYPLATTSAHVFSCLLNNALYSRHRGQLPFDSRKLNTAQLSQRCFTWGTYVRFCFLL